MGRFDKIGSDKNMIKFKEHIMKMIFMTAASVSVLAVLLICLFLFANGIPAITKIGPMEFLFGTVWKPSNDKFGIFPMILASIYVTGGAVLVGVPIALFTAVFMVWYCPQRIYRPLKSGIELMAGVPSIVYGFFGLVWMVPMIRKIFGGTGTSWLAASLLLGIMILPTIIGPAESALRSVPESYYEGSLAMGATKERSIYLVMIPAAKSGILSAIVLGIGRAVGETMAVIMVAGNQARLPQGLLKGLRTLTANIVTEMGYATGIHREALIATGVVLFVFILLINLSLSLLNRRFEHAD